MRINAIIEYCNRAVNGLKLMPKVGICTVLIGICLLFVNSRLIVLFRYWGRLLRELLLLKSALCASCRGFRRAGIEHRLAFAKYKHRDAQVTKQRRRKTKIHAAP